MRLPGRPEGGSAASRWGGRRRQDTKNFAAEAVAEEGRRGGRRELNGQEAGAGGSGEFGGQAGLDLDSGCR